MSIRISERRSREINRALAYERRLVRTVEHGGTRCGTTSKSPASMRLVRVPKPTASAKAAKQAGPRLYTRDFLLSILAGNAYGYAFSSFILLPVFMVSQLGSGPTEIGYAAAAFGLSAVLATPFVASVVDRFARGRLLAAGALTLAATSVAFMAVTEYGSFLLVLRAVQGAAFALVLASMPTLIAEIAPEERLGEALGLSGASMLIMNAVAPALGEPLAKLYGWTPVFALAALTAVASAAVALRLPQRATASAAAAGADEGQGLGFIVRMPVFAAYAQITFLGALAFGTVFTFLGPYMIAEGVGRVSDFFAAYAGAAVGIRLLAGHLPDRYGRRPVALAMMAVYAFVPPAVLLADTTARLLILGAIFGGAHGLMHPSINALAIASAEPWQRGRVMALFSGAFSAGAWGGGLAFGPIAESLGYGVVFVLGGFCCLAGLILLLRCPELGRKPQALGTG